MLCQTYKWRENMLILSRKKSQVIKIGPDIEIIVLGNRGRQVNLGIKAPKELAIYRKEIYCEKAMLRMESDQQGSK